MTTNNINGTIFNNGVGFDFSNSMKLIRWDAIQVLQPEKVEILTKWFEAIKVPYTRNSTPVIDMTTGIVYPTIGLGNIATTTKYALVRKNVITAITENKVYTPVTKITETVNGYRKGRPVDKELHSDYMGNNVINHWFISASDISKNVIEALYYQFLDSGIEFDGIGKYTPTSKVERSEDKIKRRIQEIEELIEKLEGEINKMRPGQWGIGDIRKELKEALKTKKNLEQLLENKEIICEGVVKVTPALCQKIGKKLPYYVSSKTIQRILELAIELK